MSTFKKKGTQNPVKSKYRSDMYLISFKEIRIGTEMKLITPNKAIYLIGNI